MFYVLISLLSNETPAILAMIKTLIDARNTCHFFRDSQLVKKIYVNDANMITMAKRYLQPWIESY
jgi:hypothetical protein